MHVSSNHLMTTENVLAWSAVCKSDVHAVKWRTAEVLDLVPCWQIAQFKQNVIGI